MGKPINNTVSLHALSSRAKNFKRKRKRFIFVKTKGKI